MMKILASTIALLITVLSFPCLAATSQPSGTQNIYAAAQPSLVGVQFTWESELGRRDLISTGVVINKDGLVATSLVFLNPRIPNSQLKNFKILVPSALGDPDEIDAKFVGRDERCNLAFIKATSAHTWTPLTFRDSPINVGDEVYSVGLLPKSAGYRPYLTHGMISAQLHREMPMLLVADGLSSGGSPVFNSAGEAIGMVVPMDFSQALLNDPRLSLTSLINPSMFFLPTRDFLFAFTDLPTPDQDEKMPWIGVVELQGLTKDMNEYYGLKDQPALQVGDVVPGTPADQGGMKRGMIIVSMNGKPLQRGDDAEQIPAILHNSLIRMHVGDKVSFGVLSAPNQPAKNITLTLAARPPSANTAKRYWAEDLGFGVRELVFDDRYQRHLAADAKGVAVTLVKPQSAAMIARLSPEDMVTQINGTPVESVDQFKKVYENLRKTKATEAVLLVVLRDGNNQVIRIEPPQ